MIKTLSAAEKDYRRQQFSTQTNGITSLVGPRPSPPSASPSPLGFSLRPVLSVELRCSEMLGKGPDNSSSKGKRSINE